MKNWHFELSRKDLKMNLIFFSSGCILILFGKILNSHSQLLSREDNGKCGWCMQHPMSVFQTTTPKFSFLISASLFITCGFHIQKIIAEELFIITKDVSTYFTKMHHFISKTFQKAKMKAFFNIINSLFFPSLSRLRVYCFIFASIQSNSLFSTQFFLIY